MTVVHYTIARPFNPQTANVERLEARRKVRISEEPGPGGASQSRISQSGQYSQRMVIGIHPRVEIESGQWERQGRTYLEYQVN